MAVEAVVKLCSTGRGFVCHLKADGRILVVPPGYMTVALGPPSGEGDETTTWADGIRMGVFSEAALGTVQRGLEAMCVAMPALSSQVGYSKLVARARGAS